MTIANARIFGSALALIAAAAVAAESPTGTSTCEQRVGLMVDGVKLANVELHNMNHGGCDLGVSVRGGGESMRLLCRGRGKDTRVLALGAQVGKDGPPFDNPSPQATLAVLEAKHFTDGGGASPIPDMGTSSRELILTMLASTRAERPRPLTPVPTGATDARFFRVVSTQGRDCLRLTAN